MSDQFPHQAEYAHEWAAMNINPSKLELFQAKAKLIISHKSIYKELEDKSGVPWYFIGLVHLRESDCDFKTHLHNGDPLTRRTTHVPKGLPKIWPPPRGEDRFIYSALDALQAYGGVDNWSIERCAYFLEKYNGFGYRQYHVNSPYLWAGTDQYTRGKYIRDGVFDRNAVDKQLGAMGVLKCILDMDSETSAVSFMDDTELPDWNYKADPDVSHDTLKQTSKKWQLMDTMHNYIKVIGSAMVAFYTWVQTLSYEDATEYLAKVKTTWAEFGPIAIIIILGAGYLIISQMKKHTTEDINQGRYIPSGNKDDS